MEMKMPHKNSALDLGIKTNILQPVKEIAMKVFPFDATYDDLVFQS
jgi:hypothetical protein